MASDLPSSIGPYEVLDLIGSGGAASVYSVRAGDGSEYALKWMTGFASESESVARKRFHREANLRFDHRGIIRVVDDGEWEGRPFLVMERLKGQTLSSRLRKRLLAPAEATVLVLELCSAVQQLHAAGVVHRDIKPANIFLTTDGRSVLIDLGIAFDVRSAEQMTDVMSIVGTPAYIAPEVVSAHGPGPASDLWSIGVVGYQALTGRSPFRRETPVTTMTSVLFDTPPRLSEVLTEDPGPIGSILESLLQKEPVKRPSAGMVISALRTAKPLAAGSSHTMRPQPRSAAELSDSTEAADMEVLVREIDEDPTTESTGTVTESATASSSSERRMVVVVVAEGVADHKPLDALMKGFGATTFQLLGGRALAIFGDRTWFGDEPLRAALASLDAREFASGIGVAAAPVEIGLNRPSGEAVSAAERAASRAHGAVHVDRGSRSLFGQGVHFAEGGEGDSIELVRADHESARWPNERPQLGREMELARSRELIEELFDAGESFVLVVSGAPGIGKSHFIGELVQTCMHKGRGAILQARTSPLSRERAFSLAGELLRSYMMGGGGRESSTGVKRTSSLLGLSSDTVRPLSVLLAPGGITPRSDEDPLLTADRLRVALADAFLAIGASQAPMVIAIDDFDHADEATKAFIQDISSRVGPVGVIVSARQPEDIRGWIPRLQAESIRLRGLSAKATADLVNKLQNRPVPFDEADTIHRHTDGNPLFIEQLSALGPGGLSIDNASLSHTVYAAVQSRLDRLPAKSKELCKRAALFRKPFDVEHLSATGIAGPEPLLEELVRERILKLADVGKMRTYVFRSQVVADVAREMIPEAGRREQHRRIAEVLVERTDSSPVEIAEQFTFGEDMGKATKWWILGADEAHARGDAMEVVRCARQALEGQLEPKTGVRLQLNRANAHRFLRQPALQREALDAALLIAQDDADQSQLFADLSSHSLRRGSPDQALLEAKSSLSAAERASRSDLVVVASLREIAALIYKGELEPASARLDEAATRSKESSAALGGQIEDLRAQLASARGDLQGRLEHFENAAKLYAGEGDLRRAVNARLNAADVRNRVGEYAAAILDLDDVVLSCSRLGNRLAEGYALLNLGYAHCGAGNFEQSLKHLSTAERYARESEDVRLSSFVELYRLRARYFGQERQDIVDPSLALGRNNSAPATVRALAYALAARVLLEVQRVDDALEASAEAMTIFEANNGLEEDESDVFLSRYLTLKEFGAQAAADTVLERAVRRMNKIATELGSETLAKSFRTQVPSNALLLSHLKPRGRTV